VAYSLVILVILVLPLVFRRTEKRIKQGEVAMLLRMEVDEPLRRIQLAADEIARPLVERLSHHKPERPLSAPKLELLSAPKLLKLL
jgi:hypothetical protein